MSSFTGSFATCSCFAQVSNIRSAETWSCVDSVIGPAGKALPTLCGSVPHDLMASLKKKSFKWQKIAAFRTSMYSELYPSRRLDALTKVWRISPHPPSPSPSTELHFHVMQNHFYVKDFKRWLLFETESKMFILSRQTDWCLREYEFSPLVIILHITKNAFVSHPCRE